MRASEARQVSSSSLTLEGELLAAHGFHQIACDGTFKLMLSETELHAVVPAEYFPLRQFAFGLVGR